MEKIKHYQFEFRQRSTECYKVSYLTHSGEDLFVAYVAMSPMLGEVMFSKDPSQKALKKLRRYIMRKGVHYSSSDE